MKTKIIESMELKLQDMDTSSFRYQVLDAAKRFKTNWIELAKHLYQVKKDKTFKEWNYTNFDSYCTKELGIKKQTAFKLLSSYYFLTRHEPQFLQENSLQAKTPNSLPHYEAINILRRAKTNKNLGETDYSRLKQDVFEKGKEPKEIGKQFRSMLWAVKSIDPEKERQQRRIVTVKRLITTFKSLKKEAALLKLLPGNLLREAENIIFSLESEIEKNIEKKQ